MSLWAPRGASDKGWTPGPYVIIFSLCYIVGCAIAGYAVTR